MDGVFRALWLATPIRDSISHTTGEEVGEREPGRKNGASPLLPPRLRLLRRLHISRHCSGFSTGVLPNFLGKKSIWCWLSTGFVYTITVIHLSIGEEWEIFTSPLCVARQMYLHVGEYLFKNIEWCWTKIDCHQTFVQQSGI